jgi:hypothetical protein
MLHQPIAACAEEIDPLCKLTINCPAMLLKLRSSVAAGARVAANQLWDAA